MTTLIVLSSIATYLTVGLGVAQRVFARWLAGDAPAFETLDVYKDDDRGNVVVLALLLGLIWTLYLPLRGAFCFTRRPHDVAVRRRTEYAKDVAYWKYQKRNAESVDERQQAALVLDFLREKAS